MHLVWLTVFGVVNGVLGFAVSLKYGAATGGISMVIGLILMVILNPFAP